MASSLRTSVSVLSLQVLLHSQLMGHNSVAMCVHGMSRLNVALCVHCMESSQCGNVCAWHGRTQCDIQSTAMSVHGMGGPNVTSSLQKVAMCVHGMGGPNVTYSIQGVAMCLYRRCQTTPTSPLTVCHVGDVHWVAMLPLSPASLLQIPIPTTRLFCE